MATIKDVAALAGVSQSTVSAVFGGRVPVREKTRIKVLAAAEQLGYRPHGPAQALRTGNSRTIGLCVSYVTNPVVAAVVQGAGRQANAAGYALTISTIEDDTALERTHLSLLARQRVGAVIAYSTGNEVALYDDLIQSGTPVVFISSRPAGVRADLVMGDFQDGLRRAVRHLLQTGRRRVALLIGPPSRQANIARLAGYREAYQEVGLRPPEELIFTGLRTRADAYSATNAVLRRRPDAVVAGLSSLTAGALQSLNDCHVGIPEGVAFVGTGDAEWALLTHPALTLIEIDGEMIGRRAVVAALERLNPDMAGEPPREIYVPVHLAIRASSASFDRAKSREPSGTGTEY